VIKHYKLIERAALSIACATVICGLSTASPALAQDTTKEQIAEQSKAVISKITKMIKANPEDADLYYMRAAAKVMNENYEGALPDLAKARDKGTKKFEYEVYDLLGMCHTMQKNYDEALVCYDRALSLRPSKASSYSNRGSAYVKLNRLREAFNDFSTAIKLDSSLSDPYEGIGECYCKGGQYAYAITYLNKAISRDRENFESYYYRGCAYQKLGQTQAAAKDFAEAKRLGYEPGKQYFHGVKE